MADGLYSSEICTSSSKGSGAARSDRLTGYLFWEEFPKSRNEPVTGGDGATRCEQRFWMEWETFVASIKISQKRSMRVCCVGGSLHDDGVSFEKGISFVRN